MRNGLLVSLAFPNSCLRGKMGCKTRPFELMDSDLIHSPTHTRGNAALNDAL